MKNRVFDDLLNHVETKEEDEGEFGDAQAGADGGDLREKTRLKPSIGLSLSQLTRNASEVVRKRV